MKKRTLIIRDQNTIPFIIDSLHAQGIHQVEAKPTTQKYVDEVYQEIFLLEREKQGFWVGAAGGLTIMMVLQMLWIMNIQTSFFWAPLAAAGVPWSILLAAGLGFIFGGLLGVIASMFRPLHRNVHEGDTLLTICYLRRHEKIVNDIRKIKNVTFL